MAERVTRLSEIPAAGLPMVVPEQGQMTTASILAEPEADLAPTFLASSRMAFVASATASGVVSHSCFSVDFTRISDHQANGFAHFVQDFGEALSIDGARCA